MTSRNAARILAYLERGELAAGFDADITIIDPKDERKVRAERLPL